jgi:hypothetical protein
VPIRKCRLSSESLKLLISSFCQSSIIVAIILFNLARVDINTPNISLSTNIHLIKLQVKLNIHRVVVLDFYAIGVHHHWLFVLKPRYPVFTTDEMGTININKPSDLDFRLSVESLNT